MQKALPRRLLIHQFMRLTMLPALCIVWLAGSALAYDGLGQTLLDRTVTLSVQNQPLPDALRSIEKATGATFTYVPALVQSQRVSVDARSEKLSTLLDRLLKPLQIDYSLRRNYIILKKNTAITPINPRQATSVSTSQADVTVSGRVTDATTGEGLPGVNIIAGGTPMGAVTDEMGRYRMSVPEGVTLKFSFIGYITQSIVVARESVIDVALQASDNTLNETVVIGYGTSTRRNLTGSVSSVSSDILAQQPNSNPLQSLAGRAAGVVVSSPSGIPGSTVDVQIRGINSITSGRIPLYIIDGVPFTVGAPQQGSSANQAPNSLNQFGVFGATGDVNQSPLNSINPADIASIDILKDADATAIYGSRGANGVVLITTKKGKAGRTTVDLNVYTGVGKVTRTMPMLNTQQYLQLRRQAFANDGVTPTIQNAPDLLTWDTTAYTNWQKELIGNTARVTEAQASISGGNAGTRFLLGGTFRNEGTVYSGDFGQQRASTHFNLDHNSTNDRFRLTFSGNYSSTKTRLIPTDLALSINLPPNYPAYNTDGSMYWGGGFTNPYAYTQRPNDGTTNNLVSNAVLQYRIIPGLNLKASLGYTRITLDQLEKVPAASQNPSFSPRGYSYFANSTSENYIIEPQADYTVKLGPGRLQALVGGTWQRNKSNSLWLSANNYTNDALLGSIAAAGTITVSNTRDAEYKYQSVFGRLNYNLSEKYIINGTFRRDGSSRFGPNNRFGNFGAVGVAWLFGQEPFVKNTLPFLSYGKLRGSYGVTGNDQIGDYQYLSTYTSTFYNYQGQPGLYPTSLANPDYSWERVRKLEAAIELGFVEDRILLTAGYYQNRTGNQLVSYVLPSQTGFTGYPTNFPALVDNKGLELELNTVNIRTATLNWTTSVNLTFAKSALIDFPGLATSTYRNQYVIGQPVTVGRGYHYTGIDPQTGLATVQDINGDGVISFAGDRIGIVNSFPRPLPTAYGGINNSLRYRGWELNIFFQAVKQQAKSYRATYSFTTPGSLNNFDAGVADYWRADNPNATISRPTQGFGAAYTAYSNYANSDALVGDASFIRLKTLSLSYTLPTSWAERAKLKTCRVYVQGNNLLTITNYNGLDPETVGTALPPLRLLTGGIQLSF
jgi:TonB-linked SusC/RagA family outer membrane protein